MVTPYWYRPGKEPGKENALTPASVYAEMARSAVVLLGETHDRAGIHRWQLHVAAGLLAHRPLVMGFEMFPARLDHVLSDYVAGRLDEATFLDKAEWGTVWGFPAELYLPIFRFCRETGTPMLGLNCRRGLVSEVGKGGWDNVPEADREGLTPARPSPEAYRRFIFDLTGGVRPGRKAMDAMDTSFDAFIRAQEVWDCAFATRLAAAVRPEGPLLVGIIGQGHLKYGGGVPWQLRDFGVDNACVAVTDQISDPIQPEGSADFVYRLPE